MGEILKKAMELFPIEAVPSIINSDFLVDVNRKARLEWINEQKELQNK